MKITASIVGLILSCFLSPPAEAAEGSTVGGGSGNHATGDYSTVSGGNNNEATARFSTIGGGHNNDADGYSSVVAGGCCNTTSGDHSSIVGGAYNEAGGHSATIGGGARNVASGGYAAIFGGWYNNANGDRSIVAGGFRNDASGQASAIGGGEENTADGYSSVIDGGYSNVAAANGSAIGGGADNQVSGPFGAAGGGADNTIDGDYGVVGGGQLNIALFDWTTVSGGSRNMAMGEYSTIGGGSSNCAGGYYSWAGGRRAKVRPFADPQVGACAGVPVPAQPPGDDGTFIWADSADADFVSSGRDQFLIRARGGAALNSNVVPLGTTLMLKGRSALGFSAESAANLYLEVGPTTQGFNVGVSGDPFAGYSMNVSRFNRDAYTHLARWRPDGRFQVLVDLPIKPGGGAWSAPSDARLKQDIAPVRGALDRMLALRGVEFRYRDDAPSAYRLAGVQIGFVAQDVERVFPDWVGRDEDGYRLVGPKGFEALTVEALRELRRESDAAVAELRAENRALRDELAALRATRDEGLALVRRDLAALREAIAAKPGPIAGL